MRGRIIGDLSDLPTTGFRNYGMWFWAGTGFMLIEGVGFALVLAAYLYIMAGADQWPLADGAPDLVWGTANTLLMVASLVPNYLASHGARKRDAGATRLWTLVMVAIGAATLLLRGFEFPHLNTRWDQDAYGSVVFAVILMHTVHLITDFTDTFFLAVFQHTHPLDNERFADTDDNAGYWAFIVGWQVIVYLVIYWAPRWSP
jgi:cytochrome c oxidase subunit III